MFEYWKIGFRFGHTKLHSGSTSQIWTFGQPGQVSGLVSVSDGSGYEVSLRMSDLFEPKSTWARIFASPTTYTWNLSIHHNNQINKYNN